jgi:predicted permease
MDDVIRTLRIAFRSLRSAPGFTTVAVVTLALGIGVNATIFSLVNAVLYRPLPVEAPDRLVNLYGHSVTSASHDALSYPNFLDYREQAETLDGVMAHTNFFASLSVRGSSELVVGELVTRDYFRVLGVAPALGRAFAEDEFAAAGAGPVAVLSHTFWQTRFGGDPGIIGRTFRMNGTVFTVVGVAPRGFGGMFPAVTAQMWIPMSMVDDVEPLGNQRFTGGPGGSFLDSRGRHFLWIKGRMKPGVELPAVRAEMEAIAARLSAQYPEPNERERVTVLRTSEVAINPDFDGTVAPAGLLLLGAVGLVLLVACANLANMMLARATSKRRDHALRLALGAGRRRLIGQLLAESSLVALAGGAVATLLALWMTGVIARFQPPLPIEIGLDITPDWRVLAFTFVAALATGVAFGLVPAIRASRPDLVPALKDIDGGTAGGRRRIELRDGLVVAQVALSLTLLVVGALMARSLAEAARVDLGYDADRTAFIGLALEMNGYDREAGGALVENGRRRLAELPGVEAVGLASRVPQSLNNNGFGLFIDGHPSTAEDRPIVLDGAYVDEHYADALGLRLLRGRGIESADRDQTRRVAVITETMARELWPEEDALGREFRISREGEPFQVVGIVEDYKVDTPGEAPKRYLHLPMRRDLLFANYLVRTATPADRLVPTLERELRVLDPDLVFLDTGTLRDLADVRTFPIRAGAWLIGVFGVLALLLAAVGLYGVIAFAVSRRVREIGIRKALGAETGAVVGLVVRRGMVLVGIGGALGAILAAAAASMLGSVLFVGVFDPLSFAAALALLALVAALAHWVPAHRAASVDPMVALRGE